MLVNPCILVFLFVYRYTYDHHIILPSTVQFVVQGNPLKQIDDFVGKLQIARRVKDTIQNIESDSADFFMTTLMDLHCDGNSIRLMESILDHILITCH